EAADKLSVNDAEIVDENDQNYQKFLDIIDENVIGERAHLHVRLESSATLNWRKLVDHLRADHPAWVSPSGIDTVYRLVQADMLACVSITRGNTEKEIWFASEPSVSGVGTQKKELFVSFNEVSRTLEEIGILLTIPNRD
ncbi:MAG: sodium:solute symporter family protein, partial [Methanosarcinaceae archaeon]